MRFTSRHLSLSILTILLPACATPASHTPRDFPSGPAAASGAVLDGDTDVTGRCEMVLPERSDGIGPCDGVTLFLKSRSKHGERRAEIEGYAFRFRNLTQRSYILSAVSPGFDVETNVRDEVTPGQTVRVRIRASNRR